MKNQDEHVKNLYLTDEYVIKNPSLHEEDSPWKVSKIIPLLDKFIRHINKDEINLLDAGAGAGLIINAVSSYIEQTYGITVNKFTLDLSSGMLEIQKKRNPDLKRALNEDIRKTSLENKEIDLILMIDLLEHIPNPTEALEEAKRVSNFIIFKVPLEDNLFLKLSNFVKRGKPRRRAIETVGHINFYNFNKLKYQIENHTGKMLEFHFTNKFDYCLNSEFYKKKLRVRAKLLYLVAKCVFKLSPKLCSHIFYDFVMILVKCY